LRPRTARREPEGSNLRRARAPATAVDLPGQRQSARGDGIDSGGGGTAAEVDDRVDDRRDHPRLVARASQPRFLVPVDDQARFEEDRRHPRRAQHREVVEPVDAAFRVEQLTAFSSDLLSVVQGRRKAAVAQSIAEQLREPEAAGGVAVLLRDEDRVAHEGYPYRERRTPRCSQVEKNCGCAESWWIDTNSRASRSLATRARSSNAIGSPRGG
jgi:hypothetical protein